MTAGPGPGALRMTRNLANLIAPDQGAPAGAVPPGPSTGTDALIWSGVLILVVIVFGLVVMAMRRRLLDKGSAMDETGVLLRDLRAALERGDLTRGEYDSARRAATAHLTGHGPGPRPAGDAPSGAGAARTAKPGFDLTGEALPGSDGGGPPPPGESPARQ